MDLTVDPTTLSETAATLAEAASGITAALQTLDGESTTMTNEWEGDAKRAYLALYTSFAADAVLWADALQKTAARLGTLADEYAFADQKGADAQPH